MQNNFFSLLKDFYQEQKPTHSVEKHISADLKKT